VFKSLLAGLFGVLTSAWLLSVTLRPARAIWRGEPHRLPTLPAITINARSYPAFLLWFVPFWTGFGLGGLCLIAATAGVPAAVGTPAAVISGVFLLCGLLLLPLKWFVSAFAWPRFLVPPPYRDHPGGLAEARERRRRRRAGLPPTDHLVELVHLQPPPEVGIEPYLTASCTEPECGWTADPDSELIGISEEQQLRDMAAEHTTTVAAEVRRIVG
jgi:hypothetical protein